MCSCLGARIGHLLYEIPIILSIAGAITGIFAATGQFFNLGLVVCTLLSQAKTKQLLSVLSVSCNRSLWH